MKTYEQLEKEFKDKVERLQNKCLHEKTEWLEVFWAPGHKSGDEKMCQFCGKTLEHRPFAVSQGTTTSNVTDFRLPYRVVGT